MEPGVTREDIIAFAKELGYDLYDWQLEQAAAVIGGEKHRAVYTRHDDGGRHVLWQLVQHWNDHGTQLGQLRDETRRFPTYCDEWGTPNLRTYLRRRWSDHVDSVSNGDAVTTMWSTPYGEGAAFWELARITDLTSWGIGISLDIDWRAHRWDLELEIGPSAIVLSRTTNIDRPTCTTPGRCKAIRAKVRAWWGAG